MSSEPDVVIVTNSPGELSSWVRVMAEQIKKDIPNCRVIISLVPCPFATGKEEEVAEQFSSVDFVINPSQFLSLALLGKKPPGFKPSKNGLVIFLGGDYWHAALLARRLNYPAVAYAARPNVSCTGNFKYFFCSHKKIGDKLLKNGVPAEKIKIAGNLIVEAVRPHLSRIEALEKWHLNSDKLIIGIFPGSRLFSLQDSLPVFLKVAEEIRKEIPDVQFLLGLSPFRTVEELELILKNPVSPIPGTGGRIDNSGEISRIITQGGVDVSIVGQDRYDLMNIADLILTIPGTNTAECAFLGRPMVVACSWKARIPGGGLGFIINKLPLSRFRRSLMYGAFRRHRFMALPNQIAEREIVPEVRVEENSSEITKVALDLIRNEKLRKEMGTELKNIMGTSGAVKNISNAIAEILQKQE